MSPQWGIGAAQISAWVRTLFRAPAPPRPSPEVSPRHRAFLLLWQQ